MGAERESISGEVGGAPPVAGLAWAYAPNGSPALGAAAVFDCALLDAPRRGSHRIVTGRVVTLAGRIADSLLYRDGRYRALEADRP